MIWEVLKVWKAIRDRSWCSGQSKAPQAYNIMAQIQKVVRNLTPLTDWWPSVSLGQYQELFKSLLFIIASELHHCPLFHFMSQEEKQTIPLLTYHKVVQARDTMHERMDLVNIVYKPIYRSLDNLTPLFNFDHNLKGGTYVYRDCSPFKVLFLMKKMSLKLTAIRVLH